jgi:hypothetical protein
MARRKVVPIDEGKLKRMTPELLAELISIHSQCVLDQKGRCGLTVFTEPLAWEINKCMGVADEVDAAFRRLPGMCAAKPVGETHFEREGRRLAESIREEDTDGE